jgi:ribosome maturation factor RimP
MASKHDELRDLIAPVVESMGCELWGLEYLTQGKHATLRLFIDKADGVLVEDCANVSRQVSAVMDVEDPIACEYDLEVSSPGADRSLYTLDQYTRYIGEKVKVQLRVPFEGRRKFTGILNAVESDDVVVVVDQEEYLLPIGSIDKANIIPRF